MGNQSKDYGSGEKELQLIIRKALVVAVVQGDRRQSEEAAPDPIDDKCQGLTRCKMTHQKGSCFLLFLPLFYLSTFKRISTVVFSPEV